VRKFVPNIECILEVAGEYTKIGGRLSDFFPFWREITRDVNLIKVVAIWEQKSTFFVCPINQSMTRANYPFHSEEEEFKVASFIEKFLERNSVRIQIFKWFN
jgi:hypothetical protein